MSSGTFMSIVEKNKKLKIIAHVKQAKDGSWLPPHELEQHLLGTAKKARDFAQIFGADDWAFIAGLWHDLGKYSDDFQNYIKNAIGYESQEAHIEEGVSKNGKCRVDHSTAGALYALEQLGLRGRALAYLIAGHHAGLADWYPTDNGRAALSYRVENKLLLETVPRGEIPQIILYPELPTSKPPTPQLSDGAKIDTSRALWLRMLFSCLVDADFLDTEAYMDAQKQQQRGQYLSFNPLKEKFDRYMESFVGKMGTINAVRMQVLAECRQAAMKAPGLFTLTVPTGGGKTLSSMAFALEHALKYEKKRVIYVIPYTTITAQTATIFRNIFGDQVIEHHSNLDVSDLDKENHASRLACENWDAPIIVTTTVQFFESLFANRTSRVRKLHNIINSVVILDEAQWIDVDYLAPILDIIAQLARPPYNVTFVFTTATQPALEKRSEFPGLQNMREIINDPVYLHQQLQRVRIHWPSAEFAPMAWQEVAEKLQQYHQVLCIVNRRDDARDLYQYMPEGTLHLSRNMCGSHIEQVINIIKERLKNKQPLRVISTQLIEAGVDLDFPVVFRAMAGWDSIAQAAGRCNREGRVQMGEVRVFVPPTKTPVFLKKAENTTRELLQLDSTRRDPLQPPLFKQYFELYYASKNSYDKKAIMLALKDHGNLEIAFRTAAANFKLIDESQQSTVVTLYGESEQCLAELRKNGLERWILRKLQRYTVTIPRQVHEQLLRAGDIEEIFPGVFAQIHVALYDQQLGFLGLDARNRDPNNYVCS